jgi:dihydroflavonol-4-reductase
VSAPRLVIGASGFLGAHVVRELLARGERVRVLLRETSSTRGIDGLDVERFHGELDDPDVVRRAMEGVEDVYYCVVDARTWLADTQVLFRTNVELLRSVLEVAVEMPLRRFVLTSSIATMAVDPDRVVDETRPHNWAHRGGPYVQSRVEGERLFLDYCRDRGLPGVAMCVANTYGAGDFLPTPHGDFVRMAAFGSAPFYVRGAAAECVAVEDAARVLVLAAEKGRVGERYIVAERWMSQQEIVGIAAAEAGVRPPRIGVPIALMHVGGAIGELTARVTGRDDIRLTRDGALLMHVMTPLDHTKAVRELGWEPGSTPDAVRAAARFFLDERARRRDHRDGGTT